MPHGVAQVEYCAPAGVALVLGHDGDLRPRALEDQVAEGGGIQRVDLPHALPEAVAGDQPGLHDLDESGRELLGGQRRQHCWIGEDSDRLVVGTDVVLGIGQIHARLAAIRRVHLSHQRRRGLNEWNAALVGGSAEPGQVPDHTAAEGEHAIVAPGACLGQLAQHALCLGDRLR